VGFRGADVCAWGLAFFCTSACACSATPNTTSPPGPDQPDAAPDDGVVTSVSCPERVASKNDPYTIRAVILDSKADAPFAGALIEVRKRSDDSVLFQTAANAKGLADLDVPSGGKLLDIYIRATAPASVTDHVPSRIEIQGGYIGTGFQLIVYSKAALEERAAAAGVTWDPGKAVVQMAINRCNPGTQATPPIEMASLSVVPGGKTVYALSSLVFEPRATETTAFGGATDFGVAPGPITLTAETRGSAGERERSVYATQAEAGVNLFALFKP
jgi:hypothetical protein